ncbi:hypothetical protein THITH_05920 [Thioalkalivibrio paradoxus ARh 1]|uniref:BrnA antitoxin of type II toxin-antitoxin system n=1 Tax=Thioalkalivibrio paradoxus ARh 1 TaxID=713585 RepID=W0DGW0_9GAMM|nr:hypothetical protein THITH_05920 [Thioalkalivibrio paradoxus ARh 1]
MGSDLERVDAHVIQDSEYEDLPELTDAMIGRATVRKAGRPVANNPRLQVTIRLPADVLARWKATGPGWQTRMAKRLEKVE